MMSPVVDFREARSLLIEVTFQWKDYRNQSKSSTMT